MRLLVHGIQDIGNTKGEGELILELYVIGILQLDVADAEAMGIAIIAALIEGCANGEGQLMVMQEIIMAAQLKVGGIGLLAVSFLVCTCKEVGEAQIDGYLLGGDGDDAFKPVTCLMAPEIEIAVLSSVSSGIIVVIQAYCQPFVRIAKAKVNFSVLSVDGIAAHRIDIPAFVLVVNLRKDDGG